MNQIEALAMVGTMAEMQDHHNRQVHPQWRQQGYAYYRAVWVECAELLDHFGWKWWKHQQPDLDQVKLEIVDIWHFGLSDLMRGSALDGKVAQALLAASENAAGHDAEAFRLAVEDLAINGRVLIALGLKPGPNFGGILNRLMDQVLEDPTLNTREQLIGRVSSEIPDLRESL